jgi:ankyrin repeat protein
MNLSPPPQDDDPIITQFKPYYDQWELTDNNINRIGPETGHTILHNYCCYINTTPLGVYQYLIEAKGCDVNAQDKCKDTPFHNALRYFNPNKGGNIAVLMYLLGQKDINFNIKGQYGCTILHLACDNINYLPLDIFTLLIETHGCDVNVQDSEKNTPIYYATRRFNPNDGGDITALTYLLTQENSQTTINDQLFYTCRYIHRFTLDVFKVLIETLGADVNVQDSDKNTPLHYALDDFSPNFGVDYIVTLTYLLNQKGANGNIRDKNGNTLLHRACCKINNLPLEIFKVLIETI